VSLTADLSPSRRTERGPICECELEDCLQHLPGSAWDDIADRRPGSRFFVVAPAHVSPGERIVAFRAGWTLVEARARAEHAA
jgi:hypothetical protein